MQRGDPEPIPGGPDELRARIQELGNELAECQDLLEAIRRGDIDALVVHERNGEHHVYTLDTADRPYRFLIEQMQEGAVTLSDDGTVLYCNQRVANMLGVPQERIIGQSLARFLLPQDELTFARLLDEARRSGARGELTFCHANRCGIPVYVSVSPLLDGNTVLLCAVLTDLTQQKLHLREVADANTRLLAEVAERERMEDALRQSQKMQAIGQLTGGIAHDFNNMLQAIGGNLELMHRRIEQGRAAEAGSYLDNARQTTDRAAALTNRLLGFARRQALHPTEVELDELIVGIGELVRRTVGPEIMVDLHMNTGLWTLLCDRNQLENALLNIAINARDAMQEGGRLVISTRHMALRQEDVVDQNGINPGDYLEITVADTGTGMDDATRGRAFEPFFTTKPVGRGAGLGLSQLYGFSRQSGGFARLESKPGSGTTVRLYMPGHEKLDTLSLRKVREIRLETATAKGTVLLVEDQADVRLAAAEWLRKLGYEVLEEEDGPAALRLLACTARVDLLVSDVGLPNGLNGRQVADAARECHPSLPVLFITGYAGSALIDQLDPGMQVLGKPFTLDMLAIRIGGMLDKNLAELAF